MFVILVSGLVGGVKFPVYTAVPFTNLKLEIYPLKPPPLPWNLSNPILKSPVLSPSVVEAEDVSVLIAVPFTYSFISVPNLLTSAT